MFLAEFGTNCGADFILLPKYPVSAKKESGLSPSLGHPFEPVPFAEQSSNLT